MEFLDKLKIFFEKEFFKCAVLISVYGNYLVSRLHAGGSGTFKKIGGYIGPGFIHRTPPEIRAVAPLNNIDCIKSEDQHSGYKNQREAQPGML